MKRPHNSLPASQFRRKNGQQSSCENCRRSKLACDHVIPHCGRCVRLKRTTTCVYLLSPLTKSSAACTTKRPALATRPISKPTRPSGASFSSPCTSTLSASSTAELEAGMRDWQSETSRDGPSGGLPERCSEITSWESIFNEFNIQIEPDTTQKDTAVESCSAKWKEPVLMQHAITALTQIPARALCDGLLEHAVKYPDFGCHEPFLLLLHDSWWENFESFLEDSTCLLQNLELIVEQLWTNTASRSTGSLPSDSGEWLQFWTGANTTWDSLAYLLSAYGSACASLPSSHPLIVDYDKGQVCRDLGKGIKACLVICEAHETSSVNLVNAHAGMVLLQNSYDGNDSKHNYTNIAFLTRLVINMGLHLGPIHACFLQTQLEHKAFHRAFAMDKSIATSGGRPPQLTRRFNQCPLPLDLSDEQLLLSGAELDLALGLLDADGWSTGECSHPVSYLRALSKLGHHREEILELTLGPSAGLLVDLQSDIVNRLQATYKGLPQRLQYTPDLHLRLAPFDFLNVVFLHLEYHKNIFLLYRLSRAVPLSQNQPLLSSAKAIINVMTMLHTHRDSLGEMFLFFPWAVMFYGTPAAAILAIELLVRPRCLPATMTTTSAAEIQPRSEIIQELSIFISCLKSIPTTEGNHAPCRRVARRLRKILDQILESPGSTVSSTTTPSMATPATNATTPITDIDWQVFSTGPCDPDYTQWLDSSTWVDIAAAPLDLGIDDFGLNNACFAEPDYSGSKDKGAAGSGRTGFHY
ncbi:Oleate activated transcription factor 3 [Talaromyces islandicus]|uniref:Oleate activated transcription factor 3 n=1 Tax=Talaromyces islandicus TaxID=28573 RepID=A0A0U1MBJ8_TALIS|nr:Oleate activated transcription factor 3 [Talaromyces islandicus]